MQVERVIAVYRLLPGARGLRLSAERPLDRQDFAAISGELGVEPVRARKIARIAARPTQHAVRVETRWNGHETDALAKPGDYVLASLGPDNAILRDRDGRPNLNVIGATKFASLYQRGEGSNEFGDIYVPIGEVEVLPLPGGFDIVAPWGERQQGDSGYLLLNGDDVYGNQTETYEATYEPVASLPGR